MRTDAICLESSLPTRGAHSVPFASEWVTLSRQAHVDLVHQRHYFRALHKRAVARATWREDGYQKVLRQLKAQGAQREAALQAQLHEAQARIRGLQQRLFGSKTERHPDNERLGRGDEGHVRAPRGHQRGAPGHGRTLQASLPARHELIELAAPQCPRCGLQRRVFSATDDSEIVELEVKAYRRVVHWRRCTPMCRCGCLPGVVSAPPPARLINRGKFGLSVWTQVLLDKFAYVRPSQRLLRDPADHDLRMSPGTLAGSLQATRAAVRAQRAAGRPW